MPFAGVQGHREAFRVGPVCVWSPWSCGHVGCLSAPNQEKRGWGYFFSPPQPRLLLLCTLCLGTMRVVHTLPLCTCVSVSTCTHSGEEKEEEEGVPPGGERGARVWLLLKPLLQYRLLLHRLLGGPVDPRLLQLAGMTRTSWSFSSTRTHFDCPFRGPVCWVSDVNMK